MGEKKSLDRQGWLKANGFVIDPFQVESFDADTDPLFERSELLSYVDKKDIRLLIGDFENPGYHFIFAQPGGGKSSLRKRIHREYEKAQWFATSQRAIVVDYVNHTYSLKKTDFSDHVGRMIRAVEKAIKTNLREAKSLVKSSPGQALRKLVKTCRHLGFSGIYILIDNLDTQAFQKIAPLAENAELFGIKGLILKFFIPEHLLLQAQSTFPFDDYPPYILTWEGKELSEILVQRLLACLDADSNTSSVHPISFLLDGYLAATIQDCLIRLGELGNSPRLMWQLGNYLLEEHVNNPAGIQATDLLGQKAFADARLRLFDDLLRSGMVIGNRFDGKLNFEQKYAGKMPIASKPKATVFLCCGQKDEPAVLDGLYQELRAKNYEPWMRTDVVPGEDREAAIKSAIDKSDFFILCLSPRSAKERGDFQKEWKMAQERQTEMNTTDIYIIPLRLEKCNILEEVKQWHVDWFVEGQRSRLFDAFEVGKRRRRIK